MSKTEVIDIGKRPHENLKKGLMRILNANFALATLSKKSTSFLNLHSKIEKIVARNLQNLSTEFWERFSGIEFKIK